MPLPKNYMFSPWILQSKLPKPKFVPEYQDITSQLVLHNFKPRKSQQDIINTDMNSYANFITKSKEAAASFNYNKRDKLRVDSNIVLDLHEESSVLEKLDRYYDIKDGYVV